ncbi:hypothetical protein G6514_009426 [Epicoccum nigrum]|nr:hypothetical protein G6514_009426 [Epicoccum nigrum]
MAPPPPHLVHASRSLEETSALWYPLIHTLGWNRSRLDGPMHYHAAQDGETWLLVTLQPESESATQAEVSTPQGCILALAYPNGTGWIGFFLMNSAQRGNGLGAALWKGMDAIWQENGTQIIGLDGVEEQVPTYTRRGFVDVGRIPLMVCSAEDIKGLRSEDDAVPEGKFGDFREVNRGEVARLDRELTGLDRTKYWVSSNLLEREDVFGFTYSSASNEDLVGFVLVRGCAEGHRIGPLFAPSSAIAEHLLQLVMRHPSIAASRGSLIAEVFGSNEQAKGVFEKLGWTDAGVEYHRMWYKGKMPEAQQEGGLGTKVMFAVFDAACG